MRSMDDELDFFFDKIMDSEPFALSRWGDGEYRLVNSIPLDRDAEQNHVWNFDPTDEYQIECAKLITDSLTYEDEGFYWGITCPDCEVCNVSGWGHYNLYENKENLTYASIFVNANHEEVQRTLPYVLKDKTVAFVGNKSAKTNQLPFHVDRHFTVGNNAWINDLGILEDLRDYLGSFNTPPTILLFACGPLSNYLITELWKENKGHFLIDIGSAFDVDIYNRPTRGFHRGKGGFGKICQWINGQ